jgi:hypothetical protein
VLSAWSLGAYKLDSNKSLPRADIRFSQTDQQDLQQELADIFNNQQAVQSILRPMAFPQERIPALADYSAVDVWGEIILENDLGAIRVGNYQLLIAALRIYPDNPVFSRLAQTYLTAWPDAMTVAADTSNCRIIIRASTNKDRKRVESELHRLGLDPVEQWSTAHAVSFRVASHQPGQVRAQMAQTDFGRTVVAPGLRDYLLHSVYVEGPDGRQFRITDAPAQQTVANVAVEVLDQWYGPFSDATSCIRVYHVGPNGHQHFLNPNTSLEEAGVSDGDQIRVGLHRGVRWDFHPGVRWDFQAGTSVNPLDHQDALLRVLNEIRKFGNSQEEADFVVQADSAVLPTEYQLQFRQPSFGPPRSPGLPPVDINQHRVLIQLGPNFPLSPPNVTWLTPIYHPNVFPTYECDVSRGKEQLMGLVYLDQLQESYTPSLDFGSLCQILMDIASFRYYIPMWKYAIADGDNAQQRRMDFPDPYAAAWVQSEDGQRRIGKIKGYPPIWNLTRIEPEYRNVIEMIGG